MFDNSWITMPHLRWKVIDTPAMKGRILQQLWVNTFSGAQDWRDVEEINEIADLPQIEKAKEK